MKNVWEKLVVVLVLSLFMQGCVSVRPEVDISSISPADEAAYGKLVNPFVLQRLGARVQDETVQAYLADVGTRLKTDNQNCTFTVVNDPAPAAFALPDGEIVVTRGLLYYLETEEELIVLLAHLVGHDLARHSLQFTVAQQPTHGNTDLLTLQSEYAAAAVSSRLLTESFSAEQELLADRYAAEIMTASGFDPVLIPKLMTNLYARLGELPDFQSGTMARHHPFTSNRLKAAEENGKAFSYSGPIRHDNDTTVFTEVRAALLATRSAYDLYQQALNLEKQGSVEQAIALYQQAVVAAPDEALLLTGLGMVYMRQNVLVAARQHLTRAARLDIYYYYPQLGLGYIYLQQKDFNKAAKRLRRSQALLPTAQGGYFLAQVFDEVENSQAALSSYRDVVRHFKGSQMGMLAEKRVVELESSRELE